MPNPDHCYNVSSRKPYVSEPFDDSISNESVSMQARSSEDVDRHDSEELIEAVQMEGGTERAEALG